MDTIIEAIREEKIKLITSMKNIDIATFKRMDDYLTEAIMQLEFYKRCLKG